MKKLMPNIAGVGLLIFALGVGTIVISLSYRALGLVFPNDLFDQLIGLMLFDVSALIWFIVFVYLCESSMQYVFAFFGFLIGLGGTIGLVAIEVGISSQLLDAADMLKPLTYVFIGVAVCHLVLLYARHAAAPGVSAKISLGIEKAKILDEGMRQAEVHLNNDRVRLGAAVREALIGEVVQDLGLFAKVNDDDHQAVVIPATIDRGQPGGILNRLADRAAKFFKRGATVEMVVVKNESPGAIAQDQTEDPPSGDEFRKSE